MTSAIKKLIELYIKKVKAGMSLDEVPIRWREEVKRKLEAEL